jgi:hypothetical protein
MGERARRDASGTGLTGKKANNQHLISGFTV